MFCYFTTCAIIFFYVDVKFKYLVQSFFLNSQGFLKFFHYENNINNNGEQIETYLIVTRQITTETKISNY